MVRLLIGLCLLLSLSGCHVPPSVAMKGAGGRNAYNTALQTTSSEQILLNLVRLRYCDAPYFLNVSNITTQFTFEAELSSEIPIPGFTRKNPASVGGELMWRNQPTVQYTPLEGRSFAEHLLQPIDLMLIQYLVYSGWDVDRIFRLTVQSIDGINNIPMAAGPLPEGKPEYKEFYEITKLMRQLQLMGQLHIGAKSAKKCNDDDDIAKLRGTSIQIAFSGKSEEGEKLAKLLPGIGQSNGKYMLDMSLGFDEDGEIGIMSRSILSCMYYLSLGVEVPPSHYHMVTNIINTDGSFFDWSDAVGKLLNVQYSKKPPKHAFVSIKYKGFWYYILDEDVNSKRTFALLLGLYNLQAGGTPQTAPILSIPLG